MRLSAIALLLSQLLPLVYSGGAPPPAPAAPSPSTSGTTPPPPPSPPSPAPPPPSNTPPPTSSPPPSPTPPPTPSPPPTDCAESAPIRVEVGEKCNSTARCTLTRKVKDGMFNDDFGFATKYISYVSCLNGVCVESGTVPDLAECNSDSHCASGNCEDDKCTVAKNVSRVAGDQCWDDDLPWCAEGLRCNPHTYKCEVMATAPAPAKKGEECKGAIGCDTTTEPLICRVEVKDVPPNSNGNVNNGKTVYKCDLPIAAGQKCKWQETALPSNQCVEGHICSPPVTATEQNSHPDNYTCQLYTEICKNFVAGGVCGAKWQYMQKCSCTNEYLICNHDPMTPANDTAAAGKWTRPYSLAGGQKATQMTLCAPDLWYSYQDRKCLDTMPCTRDSDCRHVTLEAHAYCNCKTKQCALIGDAKYLCTVAEALAKTDRYCKRDDKDWDEELKKKGTTYAKQVELIHQWVQYDIDEREERYKCTIGKLEGNSDRGSGGSVDGGGGGGPPIAMIAGIGGGVAALLLLIGIVVLLMKKSKKKKMNANNDGGDDWAEGDTEYDDYEYDDAGDYEED